MDRRGRRTRSFVGMSCSGNTIVSGGELTNFSSANYLSQTGTGPQAGDSTTLCMLVDMAQINSSDQVPWGFFEGTFTKGTGWFFDILGSNQLYFLCRPSGFTNPGADLPLGISAIAMSWSGGNLHFSINGQVIVARSAPTYTPASATAVGTVGLDTYNAGLAFSGGGVLHMQRYSRALSDAELTAKTTQGYDNRFLLPSTADGDAALTWDHAPGRDGIATPRIGSAYTIVGSPALVPLSETIYRTQGLAFADTDLNINPAPNSSGGVNRHNTGAQVRFTISGANAKIALETESPLALTVNSSAPVMSVLASVNGTVAGSVVAQVSGRQTQDIFLSNSAGDTLDAIEGIQELNGSTIVGTYVRSVRVRSPATLTYVAPVNPSTRVVVYGDSISVGDAADVYVQHGWVFLLRAALSGHGVTCDGIGSRGITTDYVSGGNSMSPLAATLVAGAQQVAGGGTKKIWLAIGTNDYGLSLCTSAQFGVRYAALLDAIHALDPAIVVRCQSPILRVSPASEADTGGGTLGAFRSQISTAVAARSGWSVPPTYVDGSAWTLTYISDGIHPDTAGHSTYATNVEAVL